VVKFYIVLSKLRKQPFLAKRLYENVNFQNSEGPRLPLPPSSDDHALDVDVSCVVDLLQRGLDLVAPRFVEDTFSSRV